MALGDKMVLTVKTTLASQPDNPFLNVFAYEVTAGTGNTSDLNQIFEGDIIPPLVAIMALSFTVVDSTAYNLDNPTDFDVNTIATPGDVNQEFLPYWVAYKFKFVRGTREISNGAKRIVGIPETAYLDGFLASGFTTLVNTLAADFAAPMVGADGTYTPKIWRRAGTYLVAGVPTVFPDTFYDISDVVFDGFGSQNTRKR